MALVKDLHHMTFLTADMDRLISFYDRIFGARVTLDSEEAFREIRRRLIAAGANATEGDWLPTWARC